MYSEKTVPTHGNRILWLDLFKIFATIAMVLLHVVAKVMLTHDFLGYEWQIANIFNSFSRFCVPAFVMISGCLFLSKERNMISYVKRIVVSIVIWTLLYTSYAFLIEASKYGSISYQRFIDLALSPSHLWFLYMIAGLYMITPILLKIVEHKKTMELFITFWLVFGVIIPALSLIPALSRPIEFVMSQLKFSLAIEYSGYYVLGFYLMKYEPKHFTKYFFFLMFIAIVATATGTYYLSLHTHRLSHSFYDNLFPTTVLVSIGFFLLFKKIFSNKLISNAFVKKTIDFIAASSLGIYVIHMFVLNILYKLFSIYTIIDINIQIPLLCILVFSISTIVVYLLKNICLLQRLIYNRLLLILSYVYI